MFEAVPSPYLVPFDGRFDLAETETGPPSGAPGKKQAKKELAEQVERLHDLQRRLYAHDNHGILLIFQAMDAAGKDSTIRAVLSGVDPAGCQVYSFKQPSAEELDHDFLWRTAVRLPERGRIGVFNRSYYEEVLVVRVHPEYLGSQKLPDEVVLPRLWQERYESIRDHEKHLARNGMVILKFFLNVSKREQGRRFLSRLQEPEKNWKFSTGDLRERALWDSYQEAYRDALAATSRPWAPWYAIPADDKPFMRLTVAKLVAETLDSLDMRYPSVDEEIANRVGELTRQLEREID